MNRDTIKNCKRIVIKVGTTSLTYPNGKMNIKKMDRLARVISDIHNSGKDVILVSSGAIAVGSDKLGIERPRDVIGKQACSAVGQALLMQLYEKLFEEYNQKVAQMLLTKAVFLNDVRKTNSGNAINKLLELDVVPIVNENDSVSIDELGDFSDNDTLSAYVSVVAKADLLIILSDIDGFYNGDPKSADTKLISLVEDINEDVYSVAGGSGSKLGTGGMLTKIKAADLLTSRGINMIIASGEEPDILYSLLEGENIGTLFKAKRNM